MNVNGKLIFVYYSIFSYKYMFDSDTQIYVYPPLLRDCRAQCRGEQTCIDKKNRCRDRAVKRTSQQYMIVTEMRSVLDSDCNV